MKLGQKIITSNSAWVSETPETRRSTSRLRGNGSVPDLDGKRESEMGLLSLAALIPNRRGSIYTVVAFSLVREI